MKNINFPPRDDSKIFIAGHKGLVGSSIERQLRSRGHKNIITRDRSQLDLCNQYDVENFFESSRPDYVFLAAAKVGGVHANNTFPAEFIYENLMIECNIVKAAHKYGVKRLLMMGSTCIYPKEAPQPIQESSLLNGYIEPTNEPYAVAKIAGIKLCESFNRQYNTDFRTVTPTNVYGPHDNFHAENSHVVPAMLMRFHDAKINSIKSVEVWGSGKPLREFLYIDDMVSGLIHVMSLEKSAYQTITSPMCSQLNIGSGSEVSIRELAETIKDIVGYQGDIYFNTGKPDGSPRKLSSTALINKTGWHATTSLREGLSQTYNWYLHNIDTLREA